MHEVLDGAASGAYIRDSMPKTLFEKIWDAHVVAAEPDCPAIL